MSLLQIIFMGFLQGVTEFLPVSSSGHLAIFQNISKISLTNSILFDVILHMGTLVAIIVTFHSDIRRLMIEALRILFDLKENVKIFLHNKRSGEGKRYKKIISNNYRKFMMLLFVSTIPTGIIGILLKDIVNKVSATLLAPGIGLLITGIILLVADFFQAGKKKPKDVTYRDAFAIGVSQGIAVFPGISRAGITIVACLLCGFNRTFAVKYSFIMSIPAVFGALLLEIKGIPSAGMTWMMGGYYLLGAIVAGLVGYVCINLMLRLVQKKKFCYFAIYCFVIGIGAIICHFIL